MMNDYIYDNIEVGPLRLPPSLLRFTFSRSSGPGGQNVNKLNTRVTLELTVDDLSLHMNVAALQRFRTLAASYITQDGRFVVHSDQHRSQLNNRRECMDKLRDLIERALVRPKRRQPTKPTKASKQRRVDSKKRRGEIKRRRRGDDLP